MIPDDEYRTVVLDILARIDERQVRIEQLLRLLSDDTAKYDQQILEAILRIAGAPPRF